MHQKFHRDKEKQNIIKENLNFFIQNAFKELNLFINYELPELKDEEIINSEITSENIDNNENIDNDNSIIQIYENLGSPDFIKNSKLNNYNPLDLFVCRTVLIWLMQFVIE